jgi:hypothetical protein
MCVYQNCRYLCLTKEEHHSRYSKIRKNNKCICIEEEIKKKSPKVNWDVVDKLLVFKDLLNRTDSSKTM